MAAAVDGDTIELAASATPELIQVAGKDLTFRGLAPDRGVAMSGMVVADANVTVENLRFTPGRFESIRGVLTVSSCLLTNPALEGNDASDSEFVVVDSTVRMGPDYRQFLNARSVAISGSVLEGLEFITATGFGRLEIVDTELSLRTFAASYPEIVVRDSAVRRQVPSIQTEPPGLIDGANTLLIEGSEFETPTALEFCDSANIRDTSFAGASGEAAKCAQVLVVNCVSTGGEGGANALSVIDCGEVALERCALTGGNGGSGVSTTNCPISLSPCGAGPGGNGGSGLYASSAAPMVVTAAGCSFAGGAGGPGTPSGAAGLAFATSGSASVSVVPATMAGLLAR